MATTESILIPGNDNDKRASMTMGIHEFDENDKLVFKDGQTLSTKLSDPEAVLKDIDQVRDTFFAVSTS